MLTKGVGILFVNVQTKLLRHVLIFTNSTQDPRARLQ